LGTER
jgi:transcription termination factor Rho